MGAYTTNTSDKKKKTAIIFWLIGAIGILGFEYFYVGKMRNGIIKTVIGIFVVVAIGAMKGTEGFIPLTFIFWAIMALPNLFRILLGAFKDNVECVIRE